MKTYTLDTLLVIALVLAACQPATPIPPTATLTPEPPTSTPTIPPTSTPTITPTSTITPTLTITPTPTVGPGGFPRRFHVEGNAFVDQFGQKMIFRGMAQPDPIQLALEHNPIQPDWNENYYQVMASWGANIIRVPILPSTIRNYGMEKILTILDQTIAWAGENHMYVIIDFHSVGWLADGWFPPGSGLETTTEEWTDFWQTISSRYAHNNVVAFFELFNEPALNSHWPYTRDDWLTWKGLVEPLINNTIRPNDPDKIILVGGLQSSYNLSFVASAPIADISNNVAYATHPYSGQYIPPANHATQSGWDIAFGNLSQQYPVFATEFGYQGDKPGFENIMIGNKHYGQAIVDYLEEHHISWMAWVFDDNWWTSLILDKNFIPSPSGEYFRSRLFELNFPGIPTPTPLPTPTGKPGNLAYGKPVVGSSREDPMVRPAEDAVDGDMNTRWASAWSDPQWIRVDLGAVYNINRIVLDWEAYATAYQIQVSDNSTGWTPIYSTTTGNGGTDDFSVSGSGRYVRMYGTARGTPWGYSLYEFEVYGP